MERDEQAEAEPLRHTPGSSSSPSPEQRSPRWPCQAARPPPAPLFLPYIETVHKNERIRCEKLQRGSHKNKFSRFPTSASTHKVICRQFTTTSP